MYNIFIKSQERLLKMKIAKKVLSVFILVVLLPVLFVNLVILVNSYTKPNEVPSFFGWKPFIVLSGSMETQIYAGDLVVVKEVNTNTLKENDIIAFREDDIVITHRIIDIKNENGEIRYITKGDNNNTQDNGYVVPSQVEGLYQFKISRLGNLAMFIQTPIGIIVSLSIPLLILLIIQVIDTRREKAYFDEKMDREKDMQEELEKLRKQNEELQKEKMNK